MLIKNIRQINFIELIILFSTYLFYCSAVGVGYKTNYKDDNVLVIGEISNDASSAEMSSIIDQLRTYKNLYINLYDEDLKPVKIGKKIKTSKKPGCSDLVLYNAVAPEFIDFLNLQFYGSQTHLSIYKKPLLFVKLGISVSGKRKLTLDEPTLIYIKEIFSDCTEDPNHARSDSPVLDFGNIYPHSDYDSDLKSRLLGDQSSSSEPSTSSCFKKYCTIM